LVVLVRISWHLGSCLSWPSGRWPDWGVEATIATWIESSSGILHGWQVDASSTGWVGEHLRHLLVLEASGGESLHVLRGQMVLAVLLALGKCDVERLGADDSSVHVSNGLCGLFGRAEADESEALAAAVLLHDLGAGDCAK